jgi:hypothetical protein
VLDLPKLAARRALVAALWTAGSRSLLHGQSAIVPVARRIVLDTDILTPIRRGGSDIVWASRAPLSLHTGVTRAWHLVVLFSDPDRGHELGYWAS